MKSKLIKRLVIASMLLATITGYNLSNREYVDFNNGNVETVLIKNVATSTVYDYSWVILAGYRYKLTTKYKGKTTSYSSYSVADEFTNKTKNPVTHTFEDSRTTESSVSLGAKVTCKAIETEAGVSVTYSKTLTYNTEMEVPKKSKRILKVRTRYDKKKFSTKVQAQLYVAFKWRNRSKPSTKTSYQTIKTPCWVIQEG